MTQLSPINRDNPPKFGDLLIPKRGRHLDAVIVIGLHPADRQAIIKDQKLVEADPIWTDGNKCLDKSPASGAERKTYRDLGKDFRIDMGVRRQNDAAIKAGLEAKGWSIPDSWFPDLTS